MPVATSAPTSGGCSVPCNAQHRAQGCAESRVRPSTAARAASAQVVDVHGLMSYQENILEGPDPCGGPGQGNRGHNWNSCGPK